MSLLERRLQRRSGAPRPDPLRGVSSKSKTKTKNRKSSSTSSSAHVPSDHHSMHQLSTLFPNLDSNILASALVASNGNLDEAVEEILAQSTDLPTPGATSKPAKLTTSLLTPSSSSPLPPCPECPVCLSSLKGCRIYQCQQGHSLCHQCKNNSQVTKRQTLNLGEHGTLYAGALLPHLPWQADREGDQHGATARLNLWQLGGETSLCRGSPLSR